MQPLLPRTQRNLFVFSTIPSEQSFTYPALRSSTAQCTQKLRSWESCWSVFWNLENKSTVYYDVQRKMKKYIIHIGRHSNETGQFSQSKPCNHCLEMLIWFGIRKIVYTTNDGCVKVKTSSLTNSHESMAFRQLKRHCKVWNWKFEFDPYL